MNNKEELEKYKKELAELEAKNKFGTSTDDKKSKKKSYLWKIIIGLSILGAMVYGVIRIMPILMIAFAMFFFDNPYNFKPPYTGIDFYLVSYIDGQFVMYGLNNGTSEFEIYYSKDGTKWDKANIDYSNLSKDELSTKIGGGTFNYFNHQCILIGTYSDILVSADCHNWKLLQIKDAEAKSYLHDAISSIVAKDRLYVSRRELVGYSTVYSTIDLIHWNEEQLTYPAESNIKRFDGTGSLAYGNGKVITLMNWHQNKPRKGKKRSPFVRPDVNESGIILTKDLEQGTWSYEVFPNAKFNSITRGKDRFIVMQESSVMILKDGEQGWQRYSFIQKPVMLVYGLHDLLVGYGAISKDGEGWTSSDMQTLTKMQNVNSIACGNSRCIMVGNNYKILISSNGINYESINFDPRFNGSKKR